MSAFKGTPGPWVQDHFQYAGEHQRDIDAELEGGTRVQVAAVSEMTGYRPHWEAEANANLIAAAPLLLDDAIAFVKWVEVRHPEEGTVHCMACGEITDPQDYDEFGAEHKDLCPALKMKATLAIALGEVQS